MLQINTMLNLPKPMLGDITALTITSPDLEHSLQFYQKLGFRELFRADWPFPWIQISDGALLIMLRQDTQPYLALTYYVRNIDDIAAELETSGVVFIQKPASSDMVKRFVFRSPDGLNISLVTLVDGFAQPPGPTMLTMPQKDYFNPERYANKVCGMFGELAHPVADLDLSIGFWENLGFKLMSRFTSPYPWAILSDGLAIVGLHRSDSLSQPAITFFASDMKEKIGHIKAEGIETAERGGPANVTVTSPEGQQIFLFKLGM